MNIICVLWNGWTAVAAIATGLSAIATAIMVGMTMRSLSQNKAQLAEMKKQFEEENRARLLFEIVSYQNTFLLKIANIGNTTAYDVNINIKSKLIDEHFSDEIKSYFEQTNKKNHIMAPQRCLYLFITSPTAFCAALAFILSISEERVLISFIILLSLSTRFEGVVLTTADASFSLFSSSL